MKDEDIIIAIREKRFSSAKREINLKLSKSPHNTYYRAIYAFYLLSIGSRKEASKECNEIKVKIPSDPETLHLLFEINCRLNRKNEGYTIYEMAAKKHQSSALITAWLDKSVSLLDAQMMQRAALALEKKDPSNRFFALQSAYANIVRSSETTSKNEAQQLLDSAAKTVERLQPLESNQEVFLYASILKNMNDYASLIRLLETVECKELDLILLYLEGLEACQNWEELYKVTYDLLFAQNFNDYDTWKCLIKAGFELDFPKEKLSSLIKFDSRNSFVANMEICRVYESGLEQAVDIYFENFKNKPCCSTDLSGFELSSGFKAKILELKKTYFAKTQFSETDYITMMTLEKLISRFDKQNIEWKEYENFESSELSDLYLASMIQDLQAGKSTSKMIKYIIELQNMRERDPENYNIRLWLLNLYSSISASSLAIETYEGLKIKMIQHDTLSYKLNLEPSTKNLNQLVQIYRFYLTAEAEITNFFNVALQKRLFTKLEDLYLFHRRLRQSVSKHLLVLQILKMCRMLNNDYYSYFMNVVYDTKWEILSDDFKVCDNRDFDTDYKLGFAIEGRVMFDSEAKKSREYVQLYYLKELLIAETDEQEIKGQLKQLENWMSNTSYTASLSPSEIHFLKVFQAIIKLTKFNINKEKEQCTNYLKKNLDFKKIRQNFLSLTSPLSSSANKILVETLELVRMINSLSNDVFLKALGKKLQQELVQYVVTNPELTHFKELKESLIFDHLPQTFVESHLEMLQDRIRVSKFKLR